MVAEARVSPLRRRASPRVLARALHLGCLRALARWQTTAAGRQAPGLSLALLGMRQLRLLAGL